MEQEAILRRVQQVELELMDEVHRICTKNGIPYFLDSGTALGAVRHGGFIPWDDDMDVGMLREDYERFLEAAKEDLGRGFFLQTHETDPETYKFYAKLRRDNTFRPSGISDRYAHQGIAIDIFPFDNVPSDREQALKVLKRSRRLYRLVRIRSDHKGRERSPLKRMTAGLLRVIPKEALRNRYDRLCRKYDAEDTGWLVCYPYRMTQTMDLFFRKETLSPVKPVPFEDREYMIMNDPDDYLTIMYGDYMKLPPEEKRVYKVENVSFGDSE